MNSKQMMREAQRVCDRDGRACIYADYEYPRGSEIIIGGGIEYIIHLLSNVALRISEKTGVPFDEVIDAMKLLKSRKPSESVSDGKIVGASDPEEIIRKEIEEKVKRRYEQRLKAHEDEIKRQASDIAACAAQLRSMQEKVEKVRTVMSDDLAEANKEIRKKEAEIRKLRKELEEYQKYEKD